MIASIQKNWQLQLYNFHICPYSIVNSLINYILSHIISVYCFVVYKFIEYTIRTNTRWPCSVIKIVQSIRRCFIPAMGFRALATVCDPCRCNMRSMSFLTNICPTRVMKLVCQWDMLRNTWGAECHKDLVMKPTDLSASQLQWDLYWFLLILFTHHGLHHGLILRDVLKCSRAFLFDRVWGDILLHLFLPQTASRFGFGCP